MSTRIITLFLLCTSVALSQQQGDANRDYSINGLGGAAASPVNSTIGVPGSFAQSYQTQDSFAPVIWITAATGTIGWYQSAVNSVDIGPLGLAFILNGVDPTSPFAPFATTDGSGSFSLPLVASAGLFGSSAYYAMAHVAPTSPEGLWVSQTHAVSFISDPNLNSGNPSATTGALPQALGDDSFVQVPLGFSFAFYGVTYTDCYIGSNGFVTFGAGATSFSESAYSLLSGPPRCAMWWDDLDPSSGGSVTFFTDNGGFAEITFSQVPEYGPSNSNSFRCSLLAPGPAIIFDYGPMASQDGLVGCSPGNNLDLVGTSLNLSLGGQSISPGAAFYEIFDIANPNDLAGFQTTILQDAQGNPVMQL